ncbi:MAG: tetratricopeptide repeat protein [candidate division KSB1 bacterium]|nr:tetratricopeptide repeat protein [candidate division KSB1 bacterium]
MRRMRLTSTAVLLMLAVFGCGPRQTAEQLYSQGENFELKGSQLDEQGKADESLAMYREAAKSYEKLVAKYPQAPKSPEALYKLGTLYFNNLKDAEKSIDAYRRLVEKYPNCQWVAQSLFMIGYRYANDVKDFDKAREAYNRFLEQYPDHELALSVKWELENLGKDLSEIKFLEDLGQETAPSVSK